MSRKAGQTREDSRAAIVDAATRLYLRDGPAALTMRAVAKEAGLAAGAIYWHFEDKQALVGEIFLDSVTRFAQQLDIPADSGDPRQDLLDLIDAFLTFGLDQPRPFELFFLSPRPEFLAHETWSRFEVTRRRAYRALLDRVRACQASGLLTGQSDNEATLSLLSSATGLMSLHLIGQLPLERAAFETLFRTQIGRLLG